MSNIKIILAFFCVSLMSHNGLANRTSLTVDTFTTLIDFNYAPFNQLLPGDTIFLQSGSRDYLLIRNLQGLPSKPIVIMNVGGVVSIETDHYFGISVQHCRYLRISGSGILKTFYGIEIKGVINGAGIGIGDLSSDCEIDHISIRNVPIGGIYAKTDPDCALTSTREKFTQFNTSIHDNYVENAGNEGMYVGSTKYKGQIVNCNGRDTLLMPSLLDGVKIYNNIIKNSGWDGIQVSSAFHNCQVYNNIVLFDSQAEYASQMSGIILGGGSKCDCYNNYIADGKGDGIEIHGLGGNRIFNNIIVNAGRTYTPTDFSGPKMKYGIYVTDVSVQADSSFYILNNTIISPKSDGIRFSSSKSRNNLIASNVIINPGNFDLYEFGNTHFKGKDSYVMIPDNGSDVLICNNYFARDLSSAGLLSDYSLQKNSPLIDAGYINQPKIGFDFKYHPRLPSNIPDIGAYEYDPKTEISQLHKDQFLPTTFPNPVKLELVVTFQIEQNANVILAVYDLSGIMIVSKKLNDASVGTHAININLASLSPGLYLYSLHAGSLMVSGKFVKID